MYSSSVYEMKTSIGLPVMGTLGTIAFLGGLAGTGTTFNVDNLDSWLAFVQPRTHLIVSNQPSSSSYDEVALASHVDIRNISQHLANIREVFSPSMSELAQDLGISRQALYKWVSGDFQPDDEIKIRFITRLSLAADVFKNAGLTDASLLLKMKAFDGKSLKDVIKNDGDWQTSVKILISESAAMERSYKKSGLENTKGVTSDDWKSSVSLPGISEQE